MRNTLIGIFLLGFSVAGCGGNGSLPPASADAGAQMAVDSSQPALPDLTAALPDLTPLQPPPFPQIDKHSGNILASPQIVTVTFPGYRYQKLVGDWADFVVRSTWLQAVGPEYGVTSATSLKKYVMPNAAQLTMTDAMVQSLLEQEMQAMNLPGPDANYSSIVYLVYIPTTTTFTDENGDKLCNAYDGYHRNARTGGRAFAYAIIGDCRGGSQDDVTATAGHELIETASDPFERPGDGYFLDIAAPDPWSLEWGQENADLCDNDPYIHEGGFGFQRIWSNRAAMAGMNPCVPEPTDPYMTIVVSPATMPSVNPGDIVTFTLTGWSSAPIGSWSLSLSDADYADYGIADIAPRLSAHTLGTGTSVTLTMTAPANAQSGSACGVLVLSGSDRNMWPVGFTIN